MEFQRTITDLLHMHSEQDPRLITELLTFVQQRSHRITNDIKDLPTNMSKEFDELLDVILKAADTKLERGDMLDDYLRRVYHEAERLPQCLSLNGSDIERDEHPVSCGGSCNVYKGTYTGQAIAIKVPTEYSGSSTEDREKRRKEFRREAINWRLLRHSNVYPFWGLCDFGNGSPCLISPWCSYGPVTSFLKNYPDHDRLQLVQDIAEGLRYLHGRGFVHGDLKAANILVDDKKVACIADFGIGKFLQKFSSTAGTTTSKGTLGWMPPEQLNSKINASEARSPQSDVYSFALVCIEIYTGGYPWGEKGVSIIGILGGERPDRPAAMPDEIWHIVRSCWKQDPKDRMSADQIVSCLSYYRALERTSTSIAELKTFNTSDLSREARLIATNKILTDIMDVFAVLGNITKVDEDCANVVHAQQAKIAVKVQALSTGSVTANPDSANGSARQGTTPVTSSSLHPQTPQTTFPSAQFSPTSPVPSFLHLLNQTANQCHSRVEWRSVASGPVNAQAWTAACIVDGVERGSGTSDKLKPAKEEAARKAYSALGWDKLGMGNHSRSSSLQSIQSPISDYEHAVTSPLLSSSFQPQPQPPFQQTSAFSSRSQTLPVVVKSHIQLFNELGSRNRLRVEYPTVSAGPDHDLKWTVRVLVNGQEKGRATGKSKQAAKEEAARQAYVRMG